MPSTVFDWGFSLMMRDVYAMFFPSKRFEKFARKYLYDDRQT
jgi:hypothetical protein